MKPFLKEVAEDLVAQFGDKLQHCAIVFNNKRPAAYLQKYLAEVYQKPFWSPTFFTIQELFAKSTNYKIADFYAQFFTLYKLYNQLLAKENLGSLDMAQFFPIAKIILSDFSQIDNDLVDADKLYHELEDIALINQQFDFLSPEQHEFLSQFWTSYSEGKHKRQQENFIKMWRRMPLLYRQFHEELAKQKLQTIGMSYRKLAEEKYNNSAFLDEFAEGKLIFVGFNALTKAETKVFKRWQEQDLARFYFDTDAYYLNDPLQEAGLFLRKNIDKIGLVNTLDNQRTFIKERQREVNVYKVQGHNVQAKILNDIVRDEYVQLATNKDYGDTAIVLADESLLLPALQTIPSRLKDALGNETGLDVNLNVTMGVSFISSTLFGLADLWLNIQKSIHQFKPGEEITFSFKSVEAFLSHPLVGLSEKMREKILKAFVTEQIVHVPQSRLLPQKGIFIDFFQKIDQPVAIVKGLKETLEAVLKRQLQAKNLKKIDSELFIKTIQELNRLYDTLSKYANQKKQVLEVRFVVSLIQKTLQSIAVPLSGNPLNGLQVMGLLESRNLNFKHIVLLGLNDGIVPKTTIGNSFIPDSLRRVYGLPVLENQDAISAYMFYRLIQRAEKVSVVYNSLTDESNSGEPSRFLKQLEYESGWNFNYFHQEMNVEVEKSEATEIEKTEEIMKVLNDFSTGKRTLSASALTTYIANPIDFFFNYIAGIKEPEEVHEVVEANDLGSILHGTMEDFYNILKSENPTITRERIAEKRKDILTLIKANFNKVMYDNAERQTNFSGMQLVVLAIVEEYCNIILNYDEKCAPFTIIHMEEAMVVPYTFTDANGIERTIHIKGIIDRVDLTGEGITRIVDYKTGSDKLSYHSIEESFNTHGKNLNKALVQTLFYTYVFEQAKNLKFVEPNLYVLKTMNKDGVLFQSYRKVDDGKGGAKRMKLSLSSEFLIAEKELFLKELNRTLAELFDKNVPFKVSENPLNYQYSRFGDLMVR